MNNLVHIADPGEAVAVERALYEEGSPQGALVLWMTTQALVVPRALARRPGFNAARRDLMRRGVPVVVRSTGGGVVPQGPGILNITVTLPTAAAARRPMTDYAWLAAPMCELLGRHGCVARLGHVPGSFCDGAQNVVVSDRKLAGMAQRRGRTTALLHMVLLINPEFTPMFAAIEALRAQVGERSPLNPRAHVTMGSLDAGLADLGAVASELHGLYSRHLRKRIACETPQATGTE